MNLQVVEWAATWPMVLPYFDGSVPAGFPSPAEDYLETRLDLHDFLIDNKAATFLMWVDGDSMRDAGILDRDLLVVAVNGEYAVKKLTAWTGLCMARTGKPSLQPIRVSIGEHLHVFGVVKHAIHKLL